MYFSNVLQFNLNLERERKIVEKHLLVKNWSPTLWHMENALLYVFKMSLAQIEHKPKDRLVSSSTLVFLTTCQKIAYTHNLQNFQPALYLRMQQCMHMTCTLVANMYTVCILTAWVHTSHVQHFSAWDAYVCILYMRMEVYSMSTLTWMNRAWACVWRTCVGHKNVHRKN